MIAPAGIHQLLSGLSARTSKAENALSRSQKLGVIDRKWPQLFHSSRTQTNLTCHAHRWVFIKCGIWQVEFDGWRKNAVQFSVHQMPLGKTPHKPDMAKLLLYRPVAQHESKTGFAKLPLQSYQKLQMQIPLSIVDPHQLLTGTAFTWCADDHKMLT